jgi:hypothetical protein
MGHVGTFLGHLRGLQMALSEGTPTGAGEVKRAGFPHTPEDNYRLENAAGVSTIKHGSSLRNKRAGEPVEAFEGVSAGITDGRILWGIVKLLFASQCPTSAPK